MTSLTKNVSDRAKIGYITNQMDLRRLRLNYASIFPFTDVKNLDFMNISLDLAYQMVMNRAAGELQ